MSTIATAVASPDAPSLLVDVKTAAKLLGIGTSLCWKMVYSGKLPHRRLGRCVRIPTAAIRKIVDGELDLSDAQ